MLLQQITHLTTLRHLKPHCDCLHWEFLLEPFKLPTHMWTLALPEVKIKKESKFQMKLFYLHSWMWQSVLWFSCYGVCQRLELMLLEVFSSLKGSVSVSFISWFVKNIFFSLSLCNFYSCLYIWMEKQLQEIKTEERKGLDGT